MKNSNDVTLNDNIIYDRDLSKVFEGFYSLDKQLQYLHSKNLYVTNINATAVVYNGYYGFKDVAKIDDLTKKDEIIRKNIVDLVKLSLGSYVSFQMEEPIFYDYTKFDDDFIKNNYKEGIRNCVPYYQEYYDNIIFSNLFGEEGSPQELYFSRYIEKTFDQTSGKNNTARLVKSTPTGRALSEFDEAAFADTIYPTIILSILACILIVYLIFVFL